MKRILLFFVMALLPYLSFAQKQTEDQSRYLAGAVPVVDGKVVFSKDYNVPSLSKNDIYEKGMAWMESVLNHNFQSSRMLIVDQEKGYLLGMNERYLIFKSSFISVDRATVNYVIRLDASDGLCKASVQKIKYTYPGQNDKPDKFLAEEWITDEEALNKDKTKLAFTSGKFRMKTIDMVDSLFVSLGNALGTQGTASSAAPAAQTTAQQPVQQTTAAQTVVPVTAAVASIPSDMAGYKKIDPESIPGNIIKMISKDWMLITAGNSSDFNMMTASWGGIGFLYNKPVAFCFVNPARYTYKYMESGDTYTLTFFTENYRSALEYCGSVSGRDTDKVKGSGLTPITLPGGGEAFSEAWLIIECRKFVSQSISLDSIHDETEKEKRSTNAMHKMYIGEIINVYVK